MMRSPRPFVLESEGALIALYSCVRAHLAELDPDDDPEYTAHLTDIHRNLADAIGWEGIARQPIIRPSPDDGDHMDMRGIGVPVLDRGRRHDETTDCDQFILSENRQCEQPAVYHDEIRGQSYCEAHAQAWQRWRGAEDMTGMDREPSFEEITQQAIADDHRRDPGLQP